MNQTTALYYNNSTVESYLHQTPEREFETARCLGNLRMRSKDIKMLPKLNKFEYLHMDPALETFAKNHEAFANISFRSSSSRFWNFRPLPWSFLLLIIFKKVNAISSSMNTVNKTSTKYFYALWIYYRTKFEKCV